MTLRHAHTEADHIVFVDDDDASIVLLYPLRIDRLEACTTQKHLDVFYTGQRAPAHRCPGADADAVLCALIDFTNRTGRNFRMMMTPAKWGVSHGRA